MSESSSAELEKFYGAPENFLEIAVRNPTTQFDNSQKYTDYEIICKVQHNLYS